MKYRSSTLKIQTSKYQPEFRKKQLVNWPWLTLRLRLKKIHRYKIYNQTWPKRKKSIRKIWSKFKKTKMLRLRLLKSNWKNWVMQKNWKSRINWNMTRNRKMSRKRLKLKMKFFKEKLLNLKPKMKKWLTKVCSWLSFKKLRKKKRRSTINYILSLMMSNRSLKSKLES